MMVPRAALVHAAWHRGQGSCRAGSQAKVVAPLVPCTPPASRHRQGTFSSAHVHPSLRTAQEDTCSLLLHPRSLPNLTSLPAAKLRSAHLNQSSINRLLKKTNTNANIYQEWKKGYSEMRPCYCLKPGKPGGCPRRLVWLQSCSIPQLSMPPPGCPTCLCPPGVL